MEKLPKLVLFGSFSLMGWLGPAFYPLSAPVTGFSLSLRLFSAIALTSESRTQARVRQFTQSQQNHELEMLATEMALSQQMELDALNEQYGFGTPEPYDPQPLPGATIHQNQLPEAPADGNGFNLDWLLSSNSHHALLCGDTGAGKTILARWLLGQLGISDVMVLDPDDDGQTWAGYTVVGTDDDYAAINQAYGEALTEFNQRTPNDRSLTPKAIVLEELPDHLEECKDAEKVLSRLLRRGRKRKVFILAISQDANEKAIKLSAPVRKCFTAFYLQGYAYHALKYLVPQSDRPILGQQLRECARPCLVNFKGSWYTWDVPQISETTVSSPPRTMFLPKSQTVSSPSTLTAIASLPTLNISNLHTAVVDLAKQQVNGLVSVRDVQRSFSSQFSNAQEVKDFFKELVGLELGEIHHDSRYDRLLFKAF